MNKETTDGCLKAYNTFVRMAEQNRVSIVNICDDWRLKKTPFANSVLHLEYARLMTGEEWLDVNKHQYYRDVFFQTYVNI